MSTRTTSLVLAISLAVLAVNGSTAQETGEVRGRVRLLVSGTSLAELGAAAVYLEVPGADLAPDGAEEVARIVQKDAAFHPAFLVVPAGHRVEMPNADAFYHNVFSYSRPNDFDLGLYPMGESRSVALRHAGVVHVYCSIHESMRAVVLVSPSPWFATLDERGEFRISGVPAGEYRLHTFNERLPSVTRPVSVRAGSTTNLEIEIAPDGSSP